ncbi:unnamed protein product [Penicillium salamii]|uniref:non-specific serine/threonine protein kinase n=1 Tax=Penicillium salamii TaxID=1612424 RepID=A0A9W4JN15_9EURO|nr:unnamed protein product [Penicillium salamii]CAG8299819.1 unnamed protein product [Penicillium salamii]CAG8353474.1 unnamed protein product [Penicillium salamii]CAG8359599.1 unnamed protein product [Penicillium salamii]CAG8367921.1 unnamed protein product [Penicillium salamii]
MYFIKDTKSLGNGHMANFLPCGYPETSCELQKDVTLKILKAGASENSQELSIHNELSSAQPHAGKEHVIPLLDHFEHEGPNGVHLCLVFPLMMSDGEAMTIRGKGRNASYVRAVSRQIILGLDFLHQNNMIHGDLQPANILFTVNEIQCRDFLIHPQFSPVRWLPGITPDSSAPRYLMVSQRPRGMLDDASASSLMVKIGDLGGAIRTNDSNSSPVTPLALRAPELIEGQAWDEKIDIWALGCLIFQLATNEPLFPLMSFGCGVEEMRKDLKTLIQHVLGRGYNNFAIYVGERLPSDFGSKDIEAFALFLTSMLERSPQSRATADDNRHLVKLLYQHNSFH